MKLSDFGLTRAYSSCSETLHGTPNYLPPEVFLYNEYNETCDIYAFSMVLWQIFTQRLLYIKYKTVEDLSVAVVGGERPVINNAIPEQFRELLMSMWSKDVERRPSIKTILYTLSLGYLDEIDCYSARVCWIFLCSGIVRDNIRLSEMNKHSNFSAVFQGCHSVSTKMFNYAATCFGNIWESKVQERVHCFLQNTSVRIDWCDFKMRIRTSSETLTITEDPFSEGVLIVTSSTGTTKTVTSVWEIQLNCL